MLGIVILGCPNLISYFIPSTNQKKGSVFITREKIKYLLKKKRERDTMKII